MVYLVGAGPGDPGLITRRGAELLARAEVVIHDQLVNRRLLELVPPSAVVIAAGKTSGRHLIPQDQINQLLWEQATAGRMVVRLKGGDPLVFGRGGEEAEFLAQAGIRFEIVPGVTAAVGAAAYAGIPITLRGEASAAALITGHNDPEAPESSPDRLDWTALARFPGTLIVYMGMTHLPAICRVLIREGRDPETPSAVVEAGTLPRQRVIEGPLERIAELARGAGARPPALLVVGTVVRRRSRLSWFETLPLFGQRIVVTRPWDEARRSAEQLESMGAEAIVAPTVEIAPLADPSPLDAAIGALEQYQWIVFTSANGVRFFLDRLLDRGRDLRALGHARLAAIGPGTADALARFRLHADLVPDSYRSEALAESLAERAAGTRILLARADRGRDILRQRLSCLAQVDQVAVYQNRDVARLSDEVVERIEGGSVDWITLTSSAIASRLHALLPETARRRVGSEIRLASLSPVTSETIRALGWPVGVEASSATWESLVTAIVERIGSDRLNQEQRVS